MLLTKCFNADNTIDYDQSKKPVYHNNCTLHIQTVPKQEIAEITPPSRLLSQPSGTVPNRRGRFPTAGGGSQPLATAPSRATVSTAVGDGCQPCRSAGSRPRRCCCLRQRLPLADRTLQGICAHLRYRRKIQQFRQSFTLRIGRNA